MTLGVAALYALGLAAGACAGSFLATIGRRAAGGQQWMRGRSRCDACGVQISAMRSVPVLSYVTSGGACFACRAAIHPAHPIGEVGGIVVAGLALANPDPAQAAVGLLIGLLLLGIGVYDAATMRIPDLFNVALALAGASSAWLTGSDALLSGVVSAAAGAGMMAALKLGFRRTKGIEGLGWGDVKFVGAVGLWLGASLPLTLALASAAGLVWARGATTNHARFPFGPFIAGAAVVTGFGRHYWPTM